MTTSDHELRSITSPPQEKTTFARATPFLPGISGGIWSAPTWPAPEKAEKENDDVSHQFCCA